MVLYNLIDSHIKCATLNKQPEVVSYLRLIKAEFMKYDTSKEAVSKPMDDVIELNILKKMVKQRRESAEMYIAGNRPELAEKETAEANFIEQFIPKPPTEEEVTKYVDDLIASNVIEPIKKNMGLFIKTVKERFPAVDGKMASGIVAKKLN